jgi:hypothetical protein
VSKACGHTAVGVGGAGVVFFLLFSFFPFLKLDLTQISQYQIKTQ